MGIDRKYGRVTVENERRLPIGDDEPVFLFRAKDALLPQVLELYAGLCVSAGCPQEHVQGILEAKQDIKDWQRTNGKLVPGEN